MFHVLESVKEKALRPLPVAVNCTSHSPLEESLVCLVCSRHNATGSFKDVAAVWLTVVYIRRQLRTIKRPWDVQRWRFFAKLQCRRPSAFDQVFSLRVQVERAGSENGDSFLWPCSKTVWSRGKGSLNAKPLWQHPLQGIWRRAGCAFGKWKASGTLFLISRNPHSSPFQGGCEEINKN